MSSLIASLSSTVDPIEGHVDEAAANGVHWGGRLAITTTLAHFPELEPELELLGSGHNADLTEGQLDTYWTRTHRALESLSLSVPPSVARSPCDDTGQE
jgi:hypothetical protein